MKFMHFSRLQITKGLLSLMTVVVLSGFTGTTQAALNLGSFTKTVGNLSSGIGEITQGVASIGGAIQAGTSLISDVLGAFGGLGGGGGTPTSATASGGGVPNVPNGAILPGPGNASFGISYVRDVFLPNLTNWVVSAILAGSVIVVIAGGIMFLVSNGNQETANKGREAITWGILGAVVAMLAYAIVRIIITINFLG